MPSQLANLAGGVDAGIAYGQKNLFTFAGTWLEDEAWSISFTSTAGDFTVGRSFSLGVPFAGLGFTTCFTFAGRVYLGVGKQYNFSSIFDPKNPEVTGPNAWHEEDVGAGYNLFLSQFGPQDSVVAFSVFQGRLVVFGQQSMQIWTQDADPANFALVQTLANTGTVAPLSVQSLGDYDVLFLDSSGIRSLRAKETSLNAFSVDIGTPVDQLVQAAVRDSDPSTACSVVEPDFKRYWCFVKDRIYVLSYFRESKIVAWSTYLCVDSDGVAFTPEKMVVFNRQVFIRTTDGRLIAYGGPDKNTYDYSVCTIELPFLDHKTPSTYKESVSFNLAKTGSWKFEAGMDPKGGRVSVVLPAKDEDPPEEKQDSTYDEGIIPYIANGTHIKMKFTSSSKVNTFAKLSSVVWNYKLGAKK